MTVPIPPQLPQKNTSQAPGTLRRLMSDRSFVAAAVILLATTVVWSNAINALKWSMLKEAVPWPAGVTVSDDFRLTSVPQVIGAYVIVPDGALNRDKTEKPILDGVPDGELILPEDVRETLGVGSSIDKQRLPERASNWYLSRLYVNTAATADSPNRLWRLDVTYYTGAADKVAHVPGRCMVASGATPLSEGQIQLKMPGQVVPRWGTAAPFMRAVFEKHDSLGFSNGKIVQYYTFSMNGRAEPSWKKLRLHLSATPWEKYIYYAKIQFGPAFPVDDVEQCDRDAQTFISDFLPYVLEALPTVEQVNGLYHATKAGDAKP